MVLPATTQLYVHIDGSITTFHRGNDNLRSIANLKVLIQNSLNHHELNRYSYIIISGESCYETISPEEVLRKARFSEDQILTFETIETIQTVIADLLKIKKRRKEIENSVRTLGLVIHSSPEMRAYSRRVLVKELTLQPKIHQLDATLAQLARYFAK